jgi:hypothetical protein
VIVCVLTTMNGTPLIPMGNVFGANIPGLAPIATLIL